MNPTTIIIQPDQFSVSAWSHIDNRVVVKRYSNHEPGKKFILTGRGGRWYVAYCSKAPVSEELVKAMTSAGVKVPDGCMTKKLDFKRLRGKIVVQVLGMNEPLVVHGE